MAGSEHLYLQPILADTVGDIGDAVDDIEAAIQPIPGKIDDQILAMAGMVEALGGVETKLDTVNGTLNNILIRVAEQAAPVAGDNYSQNYTFTEVIPNIQLALDTPTDVGALFGINSRINGYATITFKAKSSSVAHKFRTGYLLDGFFIIGGSASSTSYSNSSFVIPLKAGTNTIIAAKRYDTQTSSGTITTDTSVTITFKSDETFNVNNYLKVV